MAKKYHENTGDSPLWVSGILIPPGEGREVQVADEAPARVEEPAPDTDAPLRELLEGNAASVKAALEEFGVDTLARLAALEGAAEKPRKGVLAAIADEQIARADAALEAAGGTRGTT